MFCVVVDTLKFCNWFFLGLFVQAEVIDGCERTVGNLIYTVGFALRFEDWLLVSLFVLSG